MKFTKTSIQRILRGFGVKSYEIQKATDRIITELANAIIAGEEVELRGFGSFDVKERKPYKARNPKTGESVEVPQARRVIFRPGQELKSALRNV